MNLLVMNKDRVVGKWINNNFEILNKELLPFYLVNTGNVAPLA